MSPQEIEQPDMPCGRCDVGVYDWSAAFNLIADAIHAGGPLPACKTFDRVCVGAVHCKEFRNSELASKDAP